MAVFAAASQVNLAANLEGSEEWIAIVLLAAIPRCISDASTKNPLGPDRTPLVSSSCFHMCFFFWFLVPELILSIFEHYSQYSYILLSLEAHATSGANPACYTVMLSINGRCLELGSSSEPLVYLPMSNKFGEDQGRPIFSFSHISHIKSYIIIIYI